MTRRRILFGLLLFSALLVGFAGWLWIASRPRVTRARFEQVHPGMSREEVNRTVGGPPGDYSHGRVVAWRLAALRSFDLKVYQQWLCDDGELLVRFDDADIVTDRIIQDVVSVSGPASRMVPERIRRWLGL
jgi:hypothetical protein